MPRQWSGARGTIAAIDALSVRSRYYVFVFVPPGEHDKRCESTDASGDDQPPDMPDQREAHHGREESADKAGRRIFRHRDIFIARRTIFLLAGAPLHAPIGLFSRHVWQNREIESRRR